jgi:acetyltransferase
LAWHDPERVARVIAGPAGSDGARGLAEAPGVAIELLTAETVLDAEAELMALLEDAVDSGASVGFLPPLTPGENRAYWQSEVMKVIVHRAARRRGIGRALMLAVEEHARRLQRSTLVLDGRQADPSERLYGSVGYRLAGTIRRYARSADSRLDPGAFDYKLLEEGEEAT